MSEVRIAAEPRTEFGKGAARRVRRANKVPAVLYGHGDSPRHFSLPGHELMLAIKHDPNVLLTLETDQGDQLALPKVVVKDPIKGFLEHVDLVAVRKGEKVSVDIPVTTTGEPAGDVLLDVQATTLTVEAEATHIPEGVEVNVDGLEVGTSITAGQVSLPDGVTLAQDAEAIIVNALAKPSAEEIEAELEASEAELGAGQASGAPAEAEVEVTEGPTDTGEGDVVEETEGPKTDAE